MANASVGAVRIIDSDGDAVESDGSGRLKVAIDDIQVADINVHLTNATDDVLIYGYDYSSANQKLKVDSSGLLYVKSIADTVTIDALDGGVLESTLDGVETLLGLISGSSSNIVSSTGAIAEAIGTDGTTGPAKVMSIGGTVGVGGAIQEITVDTDGNLQVDILTAPSITLQANSGVDIGNVEVTSVRDILPGTASTSLGKAIRDDKGASDTGVVSLTVRSDTLADQASAAGKWTVLQVDKEGALYTTHGVTGGADGVTTDDTSGTALAGDVYCKKVDIQAQTDNTGLIAVGFTGVDATEATGTGIILRAGDTYSLEINNLQVIFIEATVSGEGVRYTYFT